MPDGSLREGTAWETSPLDIAKQIAKSLAERVVIAKVKTVQKTERTVADLEHLFDTFARCDLSFP